MMLAAHGGHRQIVQMLIERGASVCDVGHWGDTSLLPHLRLQAIDPGFQRSGGHG